MIEDQKNIVKKVETLLSDNVMADQLEKELNKIINLQQLDVTSNDRSIRAMIGVQVDWMIIQREFVQAFLQLTDEKCKSNYDFGNRAIIALQRNEKNAWDVYNEDWNIYQNLRKEINHRLECIGNNTTDRIATAENTTEKSTTAWNATEKSTTAENATEKSTTAENTTEKSTTAENTTEKSTTAENTTEKSTTAENTTEKSTTAENTTEKSTTAENTTEKSTTAENATEKNTTAENATEKSTTAENTTGKDTKGAVSSDMALSNNMVNPLIANASHQDDKRPKKWKIVIGISVSALVAAVIVLIIVKNKVQKRCTVKETFPCTEDDKKISVHFQSKEKAAESYSDAETDDMYDDIASIKNPSKHQNNQYNKYKPANHDTILEKASSCKGSEPSAPPKTDLEADGTYDTICVVETRISEPPCPEDANFSDVITLQNTLQNTKPSNLIDDEDSDSHYDDLTELKGMINSHAAQSNIVVHKVKQCGAGNDDGMLRNPEPATQRSLGDLSTYSCTLQLNQTSIQQPSHNLKFLVGQSSTEISGEYSTIEQSQGAAIIDMENEENNYSLLHGNKMSSEKEDLRKRNIREASKKRNSCILELNQNKQSVQNLTNPPYNKSISLTAQGEDAPRYHTTMNTCSNLQRYSTHLELETLSKRITKPLELSVSEDVEDPYQVPDELAVIGDSEETETLRSEDKIYEVPDELRDTADEEYNMINHINSSSDKTPSEEDCYSVLNRSGGPDNTPEEESSEEESSEEDPYEIPDELTVIRGTALVDKELEAGEDGGICFKMNLGLRNPSDTE
ncbi:uncharacterized protein LOC134823186 [Bolinopsis microptera]|uniref:uncharacterized protein LOC134823186 n=1 Tax=Bolinopsis microptera TaxID=2820187 RepID=UPI00307ACD68